MRKSLLLLSVGLPVVAFASGRSSCAVSAASLGRMTDSHSTPPLKFPSVPAPVMPAANRPVLATADMSGPAPKRSEPTQIQTPASKPKAPTAVKDAGDSVAMLHPSVAALPQIEAATRGKPVLRSVANLPMPAGIKPIPADEIARTPALKLIASHGATLYNLGTTNGMLGVFAKSGSLFSVFFITPNGRSEIQGEMWSDQGKNITLHEVAAIPGVLPTVTIGKVAGDRPDKHLVAHTARTTQTPQIEPLAGSTAPIAPASFQTISPEKAREVAAVFRKLHASAHGTVGSPQAPHLWMLVDPMCMYSIHAMQAIAPYVNEGKLRLSVIPLSILDYEDKGESTVKAKIMVSRQPATMVADWINKGLPETASPGAGGKLDRNMALAKYIGLSGTPTLLWRTRNGLIGRSNGNPNNLPLVIASIAPPS